MGLVFGIIITIFMFVPPAVRPTLFNKKKPIFFLQDGSRKFQFITPKTDDGNKFETKKLLFDAGGRPAGSLSGRRCYVAYTGYGGVLDSIGMLRVCEELHNQLGGEQIDPRVVHSIYDSIVPESERGKEGFHLLKGLIKGDDGKEKEVAIGYAVGAKIPSHGIADLAAIKYFMLTNMPAITLKQYSIAQSALQRLSAMMAEHKDIFKFITILVVLLVVAYIAKVLFVPGGTIDTGVLKGVIPGGGGVGGK